MSSFRMWEWRVYPERRRAPGRRRCSPALFSAAQSDALRARHSSLATLSLATRSRKTYYLLRMALIPIKTASETGYCDCICGCYELASLRDEDTGKGYCPACAKNHVD